jgi:hypothetical protein
MSEKPWWFPVRCDADFCARLRKDYPENAHMSDEDLINYYNDGRKFQCLWDHIGDAYEEWEPLAEAYLALLALVDGDRGRT